MTKEIVESDIELARALIRTQQTDQEISAALRRRGLDPAAVELLIRDLRAGRPVTISMPVVRQAAGSEAVARSGFAGTQMPGYEEELEAPSAPGLTQRGGSAGNRLRVLLFPVVCAVGLVVGLVLRPYLFEVPGGPSVSPNPLGGEGHAPASRTDGKSSPVAPKRCQLDLGPNGLRICQTPLNRTNALDVLIAQFGSASRTNQLADSERIVIYAYDNQGLLLYARAQEAVSLVVDFQGRGGQTGSGAAFSGSFALGESQLDATVDARSLRGFPRLKLDDVVTDGTLLGGMFGNHQLFFSFRAGTERLSLVQINLN